MQNPSGWSGAELAGLGLGGMGLPGGVPTLRSGAAGFEPGTLAFEPGLTTGGGEGLGTPVAPNGYRPTEPQPGPTFRPLPGGLPGPTGGPGTTGGVLLNAMNPAVVAAGIYPPFVDPIGGFPSLESFAFSMRAELSRIEAQILEINDWFRQQGTGSVDVDSPLGRTMKMYSDMRTMLRNMKVDAEALLNWLEREALRRAMEEAAPGRGGGR